MHQSWRKLLVSRRLPVEAIENYDSEATVNIVANTVMNYNNGALFNYKPGFNASEKLMELVEENKKLYERLVDFECEKVTLMEKLMSEKR